MRLQQKHQLHEGHGRTSCQHPQGCSCLRNTRRRDARFRGGEFGVLASAVNPVLMRGLMVMATG